jgi:hypothetical protein
LDADLNIIQMLGDEPNTDNSLNATELKAKFDEAANIIQQYINEVLVPYTEAKAEGSHANQHSRNGSDPVAPLSIGAVPIAGNSADHPMMGDLYGKEADGASGHRLHQGDKKAVLYSYTDLENGDNYRALELNAPHGENSEVEDALSFVERKNGAENRYRFLHEGALGSLGLVQIASGSYIGNGNYGQNNPNTLTFNFPPKVIMFHGKMRAAKNSAGNYPLFALCDSGSYICSVGDNTNTYGVMSVSGNTVSWYTTNTYDANYEEYASLVPCSQMNGEGETYYYVAIG